MITINKKDVQEFPIKHNKELNDQLMEMDEDDDKSPLYLRSSDKWSIKKDDNYK